MKRIFFLFIVILSTSYVEAVGREKQTWNDQPYRYEVRLAYGAPSGAADYVPDLIHPLMPSGYLASLYGPDNGPLKATGAITAEFNLNLRKWFTLSFSASSTGFWMDRFDSYSMDKIDRKSGFSFNLMPQARFNWVGRPAFKMYTSVGLGMAVCTFAGQTIVTDAFMFVPVGMAIGREFFFFWECGTGNYSSYLGMNAGFGYRF